MRRVLGRVAGTPEPWLFLAAFLLRLVHAFGIAVPSNDGAQYLWMSESFARGEFSAGLNSVFPPGASLLHSLLMQPGLDSFSAARFDGALLGGLWVVLLYRVCLRLADARAALLVAGLATVSFPGVRLVAEVYSEPLYMVWISAALLSLLYGKLRLSACFLGSAYWIRPEALTLLPLLLWPGWRGVQRAQALLVALAVAFSLLALRLVLLGSEALTPKLALMVPFGPLGAVDLPGFLSLFAANLIRLPLTGLGALDGVGLGLGLVGLALLRSSERPRSRLFCAVLILGWLAMSLFQVKPRFFLSQAPLLLPLAAFALYRLRQLSLGDRGAYLASRLCTVLILLASLLAAARVGGDLLSPPREDRLSELALGHHLSTRMVAADQLVTDLPRVTWAAGRQPAPPTIWTAARLRMAIRKVGPRYLVLGRKRPAYAELRPELDQGFRELPLPRDVSRSNGADRLILFVRR